MIMTKKEDLSKKSEKDLLKIVSDGKKQLQERALNLSTTTTKDSFERRKIRKKIARALTYLNKK